MSPESSVPKRVEAYLQQRRQAGCALHVIGSQLRSFARFAQARHHRGPLTLELVLAWCQASPRGGARNAAMRLAQLRPFTAFCHRLDPASVVPPAQFFGPAFRRVTPHIYSPAEIRALLDAAARLLPKGSLRAHNHATLYGLLAATGLRLSEALRLERRDVDLTRAVLHVRCSKFYKSRYVPLHPTTVSALRRYTQHRDAQLPDPVSPMFFLAQSARPLGLSAVHQTFAKLRAQLHWRSRGGHPSPRIHDLRFTFICRRLELWYAQGLDPQGLMLHLFTYVGHVNVTSTYWYLSATPTLMSLAARRCRPLRARGAP